MRECTYLSVLSLKHFYHTQDTKCLLLDFHKNV